MVNLRYLVQAVHAAINEGSTDVIKKSLFLSDEDISFLKSNGCLKSINSTEESSKYTVELDRNQLLLLCH